MDHFITEDFWRVSPRLNKFVPDAMFSFGDTGSYAIVSGEAWVSGFSGQAIGDPIFCSGGRGFFDGSTRLQINNPVPDGDWTAIILCEKPITAQRSSILSSVNSSSYSYSGFDLGFNDAGMLFFEYYNDVEGRMGFTYPFSPGQKSFISVSKSDNKIHLGSLNLNKFNINTYSFSIRGDLFNHSSDWVLGGTKHSGDLNNFSGYIDEFLLVTGCCFDETLVNEIFFGTVASSDSLIISGSISGVTGLVGETGGYVEARMCAVYPSGSGLMETIGTRISGYSYSGTAFTDFNGEIYRRYVYAPIYQNVVEYNKTGVAGPIICSLYSGEPFFNYDSGYSISYVITKKSPYLLDLNKMSDFFSSSNSLALNFVPNSGDIFSLVAFTGNFKPDSYNNALPFSKLFSTYYLPDSSNAGLPINLYFNGLLQMTGAPVENKIGYDSEYVTSGDYFLSGRYVGGNSSYLDTKSPSSIFADYPASQNSTFFVSGNIPSGEPLSINLDNGFVFLNGQLLCSGSDFTGNALRFDLTGLDNIISLVDFPDGACRMDFTSFEDLSFPIFYQKTSMLFVNGVRQSLGADYSEGGVYQNFLSPRGVSKLNIK